jgi:hypothetical protein
MMEEKTIDQAACFENMRDFPSEEIPFGYRLRSPLGVRLCPHVDNRAEFTYEHFSMIKSDPGNHARSALLMVFSITQPDLCLFPGDASSAK